VPQGSTTMAPGRPSVVWGQTASALLRVPVLTRGIRLGEVENVLLDAEEPRILGLEVDCGDGARRFLPFRPPGSARSGSRSTALSRCSTRASSSSTARTAARSRARRSLRRHGSRPTAPSWFRSRPSVS
jgi:hypothetical protein